MFYFTYVLLSLRDNKFYIGSTSNIEQRLKYHQQGKNTSTASRLPVELIFYEAFKSKEDALRRELYFKTTKGKTTLRQMLREYLK
jgi:putative endonuclease